jgi:homoserine dehydrogenase
MSTCYAASVEVALLGCGNVGSAFARLAMHNPTPHQGVRIAGALVRDPTRPRPLTPLPRVTTDGRALLASHPDVVVELLGGTEPARALLLEALERRIPVVTANKTLLARHGRELRAAASSARTPLLFEAAVLAGVPFLGTFARRPHAASITRLAGIANGTSNFILSRCAAEGCSFADALADAQRRGYAEPDPRTDVAGIDAVEKLAVLLQHLAGVNAHPDAIETGGIDALAAIQISQARELGGVIKPVIFADWTSGLRAFAGPAFIPDSGVLARVEGVENALVLGGAHGRLLFQGPGAGPDVTAATVLDDVHEVASGLTAPPVTTLGGPEAAGAPDTSWMLTLEATRLPPAVDVSDFLASHGIFVHRVTARRTAGGREHQSALVWPCGRPPLECAIRGLIRGIGCRITALRALEDAA